LIAAATLGLRVSFLLEGRLVGLMEVGLGFAFTDLLGMSEVCFGRSLARLGLKPIRPLIVQSGLEVLRLNLLEALVLHTFILLLPCGRREGGAALQHPLAKLQIFFLDFRRDLGATLLCHLPLLTRFYDLGDPLLQNLRGAGYSVG